MSQVNVLLVLVLLSTLSGSSTIDQTHYNNHNEDKLEARLVLLNKNKQNLNKSLTPVVFWHGMGDTAYGSINVDRMALERKFPGMEVYSVQIGHSPIQDELAGYFSNVNNQIEQACQKILENESIKSHGSFNAVGFSQGAQFLRALVQRCPFKQQANIRMKNLISLGGQHQGVFGLPNCPSSTFCDYIRYMLTHGAYERSVQEHLVQAEYWHDPLDEDNYRKKSIFLADINNENVLNETYRNNLLQLDNLVLVMFGQDEMVVPKESSFFGFYEPNQKDKILALENSRLYQEDRLGLKKLNEDGRLKRIVTPGNHLHYTMSWFMNEIASVYLNN